MLRSIKKGQSKRYNCLEQIVGKNCSKKLNTEPNRIKKNGCVKRNHRGMNNDRDKHNTKSCVSYHRIWTCARFLKRHQWMLVQSFVLKIFPFSLFTFCVHLPLQCRLKLCTMISIVDFVHHYDAFILWLSIFFSPFQHRGMLVALGLLFYSGGAKNAILMSSSE